MYTVNDRFMKFHFCLIRWVGKTSRKLYCGFVLLWFLQIVMAILVLQVDRVDDVLMCESLTPIVVGFTEIDCRALSLCLKYVHYTQVWTVFQLLMILCPSFKA